MPQKRNGYDNSKTKTDGSMTNGTEDDKKLSLCTHGWWTVSRPYRVKWELLFYSILCIIVLAYILSKVHDDSSFQLFGIRPIFWVGVFSGGLCGCARGWLDFWRRTNYNLLKKDYWRHTTPFYIGAIFGFVMILVVQTMLKGVSASSGAVDDSGTLAFMAMVCMFSGLFTKRAEEMFLRRFEDTAKKKSL